MHPITVLAIYALATDLDLDLGDELFARKIKPTSIHAVLAGRHGRAVAHKLVDLGERDLEIRAVAQIAVSADDASDAATEIGLTVESLLNRLDREVGVSAICDLPESNLGIPRKINVLCAIGHQLHKSTTHFIISLKKKIFWILI